MYILLIFLFGDSLLCLSAAPIDRNTAEQSIHNFSKGESTMVFCCIMGMVAIHLVPSTNSCSSTLNYPMYLVVLSKTVGYKLFYQCLEF